MLQSKLEFYYKKELSHYELCLSEQNHKNFLTVSPHQQNSQLSKTILQKISFDFHQQQFHYEKKSLFFIKKSLTHSQIFSRLYQFYSIKKLLIQNISFFIDDILDENNKGFMIFQKINNENYIDFVLNLSLSSQEKYRILKKISFNQESISISFLEKIYDFFIQFSNGNSQFKSFLWKNFFLIEKNEFTIHFLLKILQKKDLYKIKKYFPYLLPYFQKINQVRFLQNIQKKYFYQFSIDTFFIHYSEIAKFSQNLFIFQNLLEAILEQLYYPFDSLKIKNQQSFYHISFYSNKILSIRKIEHEVKILFTLLLEQKEKDIFDLHLFIKKYKNFKYKKLLESSIPNYHPSKLSKI